MASAPLLNFAPYNPMDDLIKNAMGVYGGLDQSRQRGFQNQYMQSQNQMIQEQLPYIGRKAEAELGLLGAQTQSAQIAAAKERQIMDFIKSQLGGNQNGMNDGSPIQTGTGGPQMGQKPEMGTQQPGMPSMQSLQSGMQMHQPNIMAQNDPYPGPSYEVAAARKMAGFPEYMPQQAAAIKLWEGRQKNAQDMRSPTSPTLTRYQRLTDVGIPWSNSLVELANEFKGSPWISKYGSDGTLFHKTIENAGESTAVARNFPTGEAGLNKAESILKPSIGEGPKQYSKRLHKMLNEAMPSITEAYSLRGEQVPEELYQNLRQLKLRSEGKVLMIKDGAEYEIPENEVGKFERFGGTHAQ